MTDNNRPITPPPELVQQWMIEGRNQDYCLSTDYTIAKAARWGADQQLELDAKWLDTHALYTQNLTISPSGDALRKTMRPEPPSLKEQALGLLNEGPVSDLLDHEVAVIRRALESLPD